MAKLTKNSTEYLRSDIEAQQLHEVGLNRVALELQTGITAITDATKPEVRTTGNTVCYVTGKCKVTGTPTTDMPLVNFPDRFLPDNPDEYGCIKESPGGLRIVVPVKMTSTGLEAVGTPTENDIYHLSSVVYLSRL